MNNARRKQIEDIQAKLADLKSELETIRDDEQEYFDNMPESLQGGDKGQQAELVSALEAVIAYWDSPAQTASAALEAMTLTRTALAKAKEKQA